MVRSICRLRWFMGTSFMITTREIYFWQETLLRSSIYWGGGRGCGWKTMMTINTCVHQYSLSYQAPTTMTTVIPSRDLLPYIQPPQPLSYPVSTTTTTLNPCMHPYSLSYQALTTMTTVIPSRDLLPYIQSPKPLSYLVSTTTTTVNPYMHPYSL